MVAEEVDGRKKKGKERKREVWPEKEKANELAKTEQHSHADDSSPIVYIHHKQASKQ